MEFSVGVDEAFGCPHVGSLRGLRQTVRGQQGFVAFAFELKGIWTGLHHPPAFANRPDGSAHSGSGLDDFHLRTSTDHGVGDGQSGRSSSEDDRV